MKATTTAIVSTLLLFTSISCHCAPESQAPVEGDHHGHHGKLLTESPSLTPCNHQDCEHACSADNRLIAERDFTPAKTIKFEESDNLDFVGDSDFLLASSTLQQDTGPPGELAFIYTTTPVSRHDITLE
jgi:hypothetical protein